MRARVKVCCIASPAEARTAVAAGADAVGLSAANVGDAIARVRPYGVDLRSGVRTAWALDGNRLRASMAAARAADEATVDGGTEVAPLGVPPQR